jgi:hypothetical protein
MKPALIRLSNVLAWLNFALGLCISFALLYFALILFINRYNAPYLPYDRNNNEIVRKLGSAGVNDQSAMPIKELADIIAAMERSLERDEREQSSAKARLQDCFKEYPSLKDPSANPYMAIMRNDHLEVKCREDLQRSNDASLSFDFSPQQALVAWNDIATHKKEQKVRNKKGHNRAEAQRRFLYSLLFSIPYIIVATLSYIFFGSFRFLPWISSRK